MGGINSQNLKGQNATFKAKSRRRRCPPSVEGELPLFPNHCQLVLSIFVERFEIPAVTCHILFSHPKVSKNLYEF